MIVLGQQYTVPLGLDTLAVTAEQDGRGHVTIHLRRYRPDGSEAPELLTLQPLQAGELADAFDRVLSTVGVRVRR